MIVEVLNPEFIIRNVIRKLLHYLRQLKFDLTILTSDRIKGEHGYTLDKIIVPKSMFGKPAWKRATRMILRKEN